MSRIAPSATRAQSQTAEPINRRIERQTQANITYYAAHPEEIDQRLNELEREWDIERWLELNSSALSLWGLVLAAIRGRRSSHVCAVSGNP